MQDVLSEIWSQLSLRSFYWRGYSPERRNQLQGTQFIQMCHHPSTEWSSHWLLSFIFILACQTGGGKIVRNTENMSKETICKTEPRNRTGRLRRQKLQAELAEWGSFTTITCLGHVKACSGLKIQDQSGWIHIQQMGSRAHHLNMVCYFFLFQRGYASFPRWWSSSGLTNPFLESWPSAGLLWLLVPSTFSCGCGGWMCSFSFALHGPS